MAGIIAFSFRFGLLTCLLLAIPAMLAGYQLFSRQIPTTGWLLVGGGFFSGMLFDRLVLRRFPFCSTLEHEITHALAGLPFGILPYKIVATNGRGGYCRTIGITPALIAPLARDFITLSPYVAPTLTMALVACRLFIPPDLHAPYDVLIGASLGYHTTSTFAELQDNWHPRITGVASSEIDYTDIGKTGQLFAALYIPLMTIVLHGFCLAQYAGGFEGSKQWSALLLKGVINNCKVIL